ncbi:InlB B-repeat-containing protein [Enterococcus sp.]|uniref:InlB B-repeat-containing protein n=1 Tax=Enterococcus sp. TaxID=35783 RepID=UPI00291035B1|nr:InlB B-repeat-containing protein [Enterococcus sp.]MDU5336765.1 InlB B-repeat-containing protein [Enterococcus sp.]
MKKTWKKKIFQGCFSTKNGSRRWFCFILLVVLLLGNYLVVPMMAFAEDTAASTIEKSGEIDTTLTTISDEPRVQSDSKTTGASLRNETSSSEKSVPKTEDSSVKRNKDDQTDLPANSGDWTGVVFEGRVQLTAYSGDPTHIKVPAKYNNMPVQIDLEDVLGDHLQKTTETFEIEQAESGELPVKITGTFHGLFAKVNIYDEVEGVAPIESVSFGDADTSAITDMSYMFAQCDSLETLDIRSLDTQNVTTMYQMFSTCKGLTGLNLTNFVTDNVTTMARMFENSNSLVSIDMSSFNTEKVTDFSYMFRNCLSVLSLDLTHFNTAKAETMRNMFDRCHAMTTLDLSSFDTSNVTTMEYMFGNCKELTTINMKQFDTSKVTTMYFMFANCSKLASLDLSNFDTSNVTTMSYMFAGCKLLSEVKISHFDTKKVTNVSYMFHQCLALTTLDLASFDTSSVPKYYGSYMFAGCNNLNRLRISNAFKFQTDFGLLELPASSNEGKTLSHWIRDDGEERYDSTTAFIAAHNELAQTAVHIYSIQKSHLVSFDLAGGSGDPISNQRVLETKTVVNPNYQGTKAHHQFNGWTLGGEPFDFQTKVSAPLELTADWLINTYEVRFHGNTGQGAMSNQSFDYDEEKTLSPNLFSKVGYTFKAWNSKANGTGEHTYQDGQLVKNLSIVDGDIIDLYAQWQPNSYQILFDTNGGIGDMAPLEMTYDKEVILPENIFTRKGYQFQEWNTDQAGGGNGYKDQAPVKNLTAMNNSTVSLFAQWRQINYTVTFDSQGGDAISDQTYTVEQGIKTFPIPSKQGFTFLGWYEGETKIETILDGEIGDRKLKAKWKAIEYNVDYDSDGGSTIDSQKYTIERGIDSLPTPSRLGYSFDGWYEGEKKIERISVGEVGNRLLKARWTLVDYRITFDDPTLSAITYTVESDTIKLPIRTRTGYTFLGWLIAEDTIAGVLSEQPMIVQEIKSGTTGNLKLSAQWKANQYTITFDPNGGSGELSPQTLNYDESVKLSANKYTRVEHAFTGWNTQADGKGADFADQQEVKNLLAEANGNLTLFAQWKKTKSALEELVNKETGAKRNKNDYTQESWKKYEEALKKAQEVIANPNATEDEVKTVLSELQAAIANLKPIKNNDQIAPTSTRKAYPTSAAKSYPRTGMLAGFGLMILGVASVGTALAGWLKRNGK